jgi:hypothetical protein
VINAVNLLRGASVYPINKAIFLDVNIVAAEAVFPEVTNGSDVPDANQQTAVSPSTSCQSLVFTVKPTHVHLLSTTPKTPPL